MFGAPAVCAEGVADEHYQSLRVPSRELQPAQLRVEGFRV